MKEKLENEFFVDRVLKLSNEPFLVIEGDMIIKCNHAAERFLGIAQEELSGKRVGDILCLEEDANQSALPLLSYLAKYQDRKHTVRLKGNEETSQLCDIECSVASLESNDWFIMHLGDEIRESQQSLSEYETTLSNSLIANFTLSKRGIIRRVNTAAIELLGYGEEDLLKRHFDSLIKQSGNNAFSLTSQLIGEVLQGKRIQDIEVELVNSDNEPVWASLTALSVNSSKIPVIEVLALDITARKTAEQSKKIAQEQVELWTEVMTHDLNNINQSILFSIGYVLESVALPEKAKNKLLEANWELRRGARMISNLRKLNQIKNQPPKQKIIPLASCISNALSDINEQIVHKDVEISVEGDIQDIKVPANENLQDVFFNIVENSIVHDPSSKTSINIKVNKPNFEDRVRIEIEDRGPGIPDKLKPLVFNRMGFFDGSKGGRGLGLTLVHAIIEGVGGNIRVEDRVEGKSSLGTRVVIDMDLWKEKMATECDRDNCITFYMSNHCLFCGPSMDILIGVLEGFGISSSIIEVINIDDPSVQISRHDLPMVPVTRICNREITGLTDATTVRQAVMDMILKGCAKLT
jgi:PAS domain S-box-containing protein